MRHPSLPGNEDDWEEAFSEMDDFDQSSLEPWIGNLVPDSSEFLFSDSDQPQINCRQNEEPINIQMQKNSISLSKQMRAMSDFTHSDFDQSS